MGEMILKKISGKNKIILVYYDRPMWYPGAQAPLHLNGQLIGDYGFDPLRLGVNTDLIPWYKEAELTNGRWAMAAVSGILLTDLAGLNKWWEAGAQIYAVDLRILIAIQIVVLTIFEAKRFDNF